MDKQELIKKIENEHLIVIVRGVKNDDLIPMAEAMYKGGVRLIEITYAADGKIPAETTAEGIRMLKEHFGDRMHVGAGTVLSAHQVDLTRAAGGEFIISPDTNTEVISRTCELGLVSIPGALTPTEAQAAHLAGADFVKLFPIDALGPAYIRAICAPLSHIRFLAVGGVNEENMSDFFRAGACGFGIGSSIVNRPLIEQGRFEEITKITKDFISALRKAVQ